MLPGQRADLTLRFNRLHALPELRADSADAKCKEAVENSSSSQGPLKRFLTISHYMGE